MIGIIGAMQLEMDGLLARLENRQDTQIGMDVFSTGTLFGQEAVLAVCGPGKVNAAICTGSMILTFHPEWVLNLGVAGSGEEGVGIGDMVIATAAVQHDLDYGDLGDARGYLCKLDLIEIPADEGLRARLAEAAGSLPGVRVHQGIIATGDQFINRAETRQAIHDLFRAKAVEMEGGAVAHACHALRVPWGILRSISDQANGRSDVDFPTFARETAARSQQVVEQLLRRMEA